MTTKSKKNTTVPREAALYLNGYRGLAFDECSPSGFNPESRRHRSFHSDGTQNLGEMFLLNSQFSRGDSEAQVGIEQFLTDPGYELLALQDRRQHAGREIVSLPPSMPMNLSISQVISQRRSKRFYTGDPLHLEIVGTLLRAGAGATGETQVALSSGQTVAIRHRSAPSAGGLYPVQIIIVALNVLKLPRGVYCFDPLEQNLVQLLSENKVDGVVGAFVADEEQVSLSRASAILLLVGYPRKSIRKYGSRGIRYLLLESGAIAQTIHLAATAVGIGSVDYAAFCDNELHSALQLKRGSASVIHSLLLGVSG